MAMQHPEQIVSQYQVQFVKSRVLEREVEKCNPLKKTIQRLWILLKAELFFYCSGVRAEGIIHGTKLVHWFSLSAAKMCISSRSSVPKCIFVYHTLSLVCYILLPRMELNTCSTGNSRYLFINHVS